MIECNRKHGRFSSCLTRLVAGVVLVSEQPAIAYSNDAIRIGLMNDQSGVFSSELGPGAVVVAKLAIEDMGSKIGGKPIELLVADDQNKPDVGVKIARRWLEVDHVDAVVGGSISSTAIAVQNLARENKKPCLLAGSGSSELTGKSCSPMTFQFVFDSYALSKAVVTSLAKQGVQIWFFTTADYSYGQQLQRDGTQFIEQTGGKILGSVKHPLGTSDFSSYLLQAKASNAQAIVFANAGSDFVNAVKQANEYRLNTGGRKLTAFGVTTNMVVAVGLDAMQGMQFADPLYWDTDADTRAWSMRYMARAKGRAPTFQQAGTYSAVLHYLKAVKESGTTDCATVAAKMKAMPVNDFSMRNVPIRADGQVMRPMSLVQVKTPAESKPKYDAYSVKAKIPAELVWRPLSDGHCHSYKRSPRLPLRQSGPAGAPIVSAIG